jgi:hypothetical protein
MPRLDLQPRGGREMATDLVQRPQGTGPGPRCVSKMSRSTRRGRRGLLCRYAGSCNSRTAKSRELKPFSVKDSGRADSQALRRTSLLLLSLLTLGPSIRQLGSDLNWTGRRPETLECPAREKEEKNGVRGWVWGVDGVPHCETHLMNWARVKWHRQKK